MKKLTGLFLWLVMLSLLAGTCLGEGADPYTCEAMGVEAYVEAITTAIDDHYGSREDWPPRYQTLLALTRFAAGLDAVYAGNCDWAGEEIQNLEKQAFEDGATPEALHAFLWGLISTDDPSDRIGHGVPYPVKSLTYAAGYLAGMDGYSSHLPLPLPGDIEETEAIAIARAAIQEGYGLSDEEINAIPIYTHYSADFLGTPIWGVVIGLNDEGYELYYVYIEAATGDVLVATLNEGNG